MPLGRRAFLAAALAVSAQEGMASDPPIPAPIRAAALRRLAVRPRAITAGHLALIRELDFFWIGAENLAPAIDGANPLGAPGTLGRASELLGTQDQIAAAEHLIDLVAIFPAFLTAATLPPGSYTLPAGKRLLPGETLEEDDGKLVISGEHVALLKALQPDPIDAAIMQEALGDGLWALWSVNPKRPFGERRTYEEDMAVILRLARPGPGGVVPLDAAQRERLRNLYSGLRVTARIFCRHAELPRLPFHP